MKKILIIDDDRRLADTLSAMLALKFKVHSAHSIKEAAVLISTSHFDAILTDFKLTDGDGFHVLTLIRSLNPMPKLFVMTAYAEKDMAIKLLNHKVNALLEKPFEFSKLMEVLDRDLSEESASNDFETMILLPYEKSLRIGDTNIELTDVEFKLLSYLLAKKNTWITRDELIECIWGKSTNSRNTLDTHLTNLKRKVPSFKEDLKVVRGRGFNFSP